MAEWHEGGWVGIGTCRRIGNKKDGRVEINMKDTDGKKK